MGATLLNPVAAAPGQTPLSGSVYPGQADRGEHTASLCALTAFLFNAISRISPVVTLPAEIKVLFHPGSWVRWVVNAFPLACCVKAKLEKGGFPSI